MVTDVTVFLRAQNNRHHRHNRHGKFRRGCKGALFKGRYLPGGAVRRQQGQRPSGSIGTRRREDASGLPLGERNGIF